MQQTGCKEPVDAFNVLLPRYTTKLENAYEKYYRKENKFMEIFNREICQVSRLAGRHILQPKDVLWVLWLSPPVHYS